MELVECTRKLQLQLILDDTDDLPITDDIIFDSDSDLGVNRQVLVAQN